MFLSPEFFYDRPNTMDPLSTVLSLLKPHSYAAGAFDMGGEWSIQFDRYRGIKCYTLMSGYAWLTMEGTAEPVRITEGDCFLLPSGRPFRLSSDPAVPPVNVLAMSGFPLSGAIATCNGGGECTGFGGYFGLSGDASILLGLLPRVVHLLKLSDRAAMRWSLERMMEELRDPQPGSSLVAQQLAYTMLVQALRLYLAERANKSVGWLFALSDPQISKAMNCIHAEPARPWTLQDLAECAGMSRSGFALRFKEVVGASPMEYLTRWRMLLAADRLANSADSLAEVATSIGYESESTFSIAFKRIMGRPPRQYSRYITSRSSAVDDGQANDV